MKRLHFGFERTRPYLVLLGRLAMTLQVMSVAAAPFADVWTGAQPAEAGSTARFEPVTCPITPAPIPALQAAQCGHLVVPERRSTPNGRTIRLPVAIVPAASESPPPDPVVFMTGGPG